MCCYILCVYFMIFVYFLYLIIIIYLENIRLYNIIINGNETDFKHHILSYSLIYVVVLYKLCNSNSNNIVITINPLFKSLKNKNIRYVK